MLLVAVDDGKAGWKRDEGGHTLSTMLGELGSGPQRRAEVQTIVRIKRQVLLRLSEPPLHVIHPVATSLTPWRQAKQPIVVAGCARIERFSLHATASTIKFVVTHAAFPRSILRWSIASMRSFAFLRLPAVGRPVGPQSKYRSAR